MEEAVRGHSQFGEDLWIVDNIMLPSNGLFCEVGAYDGVQSSNTLLFEEHFGWTGLLIEPHRGIWNNCYINRKAPALCLAVGTDCGDRPFYIHPTDQGRGSLLPIEGGHQTTQLVTTLGSIWSCFFKAQPFLVSIDTEGTELDVWASREGLSPEIVIIEYLQWGSNEKKQPICQQLDKDGYKVVRCTEANLIFVKNDSDHCLPAAP